MLNPIAKAADKFSSLTAADAKALKASGIAAVGRYLVGKGKAMTPLEVAAIQAAGLSILSVYETAPTRRAYFTRTQGVNDAKAAISAAKALNQPEGTPIYFAVDFDCQDADMPAIRDYFAGVKSAIGGYKVGLYGSYRAVSNVAADFYWQTMAWSYGKVSPRAAIYQSQCDTTLAGLRVDIDLIYKPCGWWPTPEENASVTYPKVKVQINGEAFPDGVAVNNTTYVLYTALTKVGTAFTHPGYGVLNIGGKAVKGVVLNGDTYVPWGFIAPGVKAVRLPSDDGWNFITEQHQLDPNHKVLVVWNIDVANDGFFLDIPVKVADPTLKSFGKMQFDTGAFEILLDKGIADFMGLPNQGTQQFVGVDGKPQDGYNSTIPVVVGDRVINMPVVIDPVWPSWSSVGLFGMKGLIDNHIGMIIDPDARTITLIDTTGDKA